MIVKCVGIVVVLGNYGIEVGKCCWEIFLLFVDIILVDIGGVVVWIDVDCLGIVGDC